jgi:hypothetical protein
VWQLRRGIKHYEQVCGTGIMPELRNRTLNTEKITSECWPVQFYGLQYCDNCEFKDTDECGGKQIIETGKNSKGHKVPI